MLVLYVYTFEIYRFQINNEYLYSIHKGAYIVSENVDNTEQNIY